MYVAQVMSWRRDFDQAPPALSASNPLQRAMLDDGRYTQVGLGGRVSRGRPALFPTPPLSPPQLGSEVPFSESLKDTCMRVSRAWREEIAPALEQGETVRVASG